METRNSHPLARESGGVPGKDDLSRRLSVDPNFKALVRERFKLRLILSVMVIVLYFSFMLLVAFWRRPLRLRSSQVPCFAAISTLVIVTFYLITQMVAAGNLVQILFGIPYPLAVLLVGVLMTLYVVFGGMLATTWVQIIKAVLLFSGSLLMVTLICSRFGFDLEKLFRTAVALHPQHSAILAPGGFIKDPLSAVSLGMDVRNGRATTYPDALLYSTQRSAGAKLSTRGDDFYRALLYPSLLIGFWRGWCFARRSYHS